jgi:universal stress protein A
MSKYKHILLATDLSDVAIQVAKKAALLAQTEKAKFSIVHVQENTPILYGGDDFSIPLDVNLEETMHKKAELALTTLAAEIGVPSSQLNLKVGSAKHEILELAEALGVDLIVLGSQSRHGLSKLLGSVANAVLHGAKCDVYAVKVT